MKASLRPAPEPVGLIDRGDGVFQVCSQMSFSTVPELWRQSQRLFPRLDAGRIELDLSQVRYADSAGLALLVAWVRWARVHGKEIRFTQAPQEVAALAKAAGLKALLQSSA
jgi:phospholipid transport system transporter-binding protein